MVHEYPVQNAVLVLYPNLKSLELCILFEADAVAVLPSKTP